MDLSGTKSSGEESGSVAGLCNSEGDESVCDLSLSAIAEISSCATSAADHILNFTTTNATLSPRPLNG